MGAEGRWMRAVGDTGELREAVAAQILRACARISPLFAPTPLERLDCGLGAELWLKREDLSAVRSYKWRGAFNAMAQLDGEALACGVVAASAGNHAQGVAVAARRLGTTARLHMPNVTPMTKRRAVELLGGTSVEIVLHGANYDEAAAAARDDAAQTGRRLVHAFDDVAVVGGQGTLAEEVITQAQGEPFDVAYLQIGGGGMASACALWLKRAYPAIRIVGVECEGQASMAAALAAGGPVDLDAVDNFCDGTCVRRVGRIGHALLSGLLDDHLVVSRGEVCAAIERLWDAGRILPEAAGALGMAGVMRQRRQLAGKRVLAVISGGNLDLAHVAEIARNAREFEAGAARWSGEIAV